MKVEGHGKDQEKRGTTYLPSNPLLGHFTKAALSLGYFQLAEVKRTLSEKEMYSFLFSQPASSPARQTS